MSRVKWSEKVMLDMDETLRDESHVYFTHVRDPSRRTILPL